MVSYLQKRKEKVVHFDLKPANIMFHEGVVKIVDFGICKLMDDDETKMENTSPGVGTYYYLPPEGLDFGNSTVSSKTDIWSIGVIFFELLYGKKPFGEGISQSQMLKKRTIFHAGEVEFPEKTPKGYEVSEEAKNFIRKCLYKSPQ